MWDETGHMTKIADMQVLSGNMQNLQNQRFDDLETCNEVSETQNSTLS